MLAKFRRGAAAGLVGLATTLASNSAVAAWDQLNLPVGVTPISRAVYDRSATSRANRDDTDAADD